MIQSALSSAKVDLTFNSFISAFNYYYSSVEKNSAGMQVTPAICLKTAVISTLFYRSCNHRD